MADDPRAADSRNAELDREREATLSASDHSQTTRAPGGAGSTPAAEAPEEAPAEVVPSTSDLKW